MGARHQRWLIAKGNVFHPSTAAVAKFVERLRTEKWIGAGGRAKKTVDAGDEGEEAQPATMTKDWLDHPDREEIRLVWEGPAEKSALSRPPAKWTLEVHRAPEYVYPRAKSIGKLPTKCACGEDLSFEWDEEEVSPAFESSIGIFAECEECSRTFDPSKGVATLTNPFDGSKDEVNGGAAYRFAVVVVAHDVEDDPKLAFAQELVTIVENEFGRAFYEVGA